MVKIVKKTKIRRKTKRTERDKRNEEYFKLKLVELDQYNPSYNPNIEITEDSIGFYERKKVEFEKKLKELNL